VFWRDWPSGCGILWDMFERFTDRARQAKTLSLLAGSPTGYTCLSASPKSVREIERAYPL
jgi:hypothetical protein